MLKRLVVIGLLLGGTPALGQPLSPQQNAAISLGQQIGLLTHENGELRATLQKTQAELAAALARLKELEAATKKDAPPAGPK